MIFKKKKDVDIEKMARISELLDLRAISLDIKIGLDDVVVECKTNKIAKKLLIDVFKVTEDDFNAVTEIMVNAGRDAGRILEKYGEVVNESTKKDKN